MSTTDVALIHPSAVVEGDVVVGDGLARLALVPPPDRQHDRP